MGDEGFGLLAGERGQRAGYHQRFTGQGSALLLAGPLHVDPGSGQAGQQILGAVLGKELHHALGHDFAEAVDLAHLLRRGLPQGVHAAEMLTQQGGGLVADIADAKAKQQFIQIIALGTLDGGQQVLSALFLEFIEGQQVILGQGIQICHRVYQPLVGQLDSHCLAQTIDGHGVAGGKVDEVAQTLGRALRVDAAQGGLILQMHHRCAAGRADRGHLEGLCAGQMGRYSDDLGDNIACLAYLDGIADADAQVGDDVAVVQAGAGHAGARQEDWVKHGGGCQHTGAADRDLDVANNALLDLGRVLKRNGPARELVGAA